MTKKFIFILAVFFLYLQNTSALSNIPEKPEIIPRASWWANDLYGDLNSTYWQNILEARKNYVDPRSPEQIETAQKNYATSLKYINENFRDEHSVSEVKKFDEHTWQEYAWPIKYTNHVNAIVIHHTHSEYDSSLEGMKQLYKFHSLSRQWWDVWYNFVIGYEGQIYEWRKGWDYSVAAHSKWNNYSTLWIAVMGNYHSEWLNEAQYKSLYELIKYYSWYYGIDFSEKYYYHQACKWESCKTFPIETMLDSTLVWHRDTGHTSCPWDKLYEQIQEIRSELIPYSSGFSPRKREVRIEKKSDVPKNYTSSQITLYSSIIQKYSDEELKILLKKVEQILYNEEIDFERRKKLQILRLAIVLHVKD